MSLIGYDNDFLQQIRRPVGHVLSDGLELSLEEDHQWDTLYITAVPINLVRLTFFSEKSHDRFLTYLRHAVQFTQIIGV